MKTINLIIYLLFAGIGTANGQFSDSLLSEYERVDLYYQEVNAIYDLLQKQTFEPAHQRGLELYRSNPDSALAMMVLIQALGSRVLFEEYDDEIYSDLEDDMFAYLDTVDEKFPHDLELQTTAMRFHFGLDDIDYAMERGERLVTFSNDPVHFDMLMWIYGEEELLEKETELFQAIRQKSDSSIPFMRLRIRYYVNHNVLDSANFFISDLLQNGTPEAEDYHLSAWVNFHMDNRFQACEDLRFARRKGFDDEKEPWEDRLNCFNEDRSDPRAKELDRKEQIRSVLAESPSKVNRNDWTPPFEKDFRYQVTGDTISEFLDLISVRYYQRIREETGFIYYRKENRSSMVEMKMRLLSIRRATVWEDRKGDTLYSEKVRNILPIIFEKDKPIYLEFSKGRLMEFTYVGQEYITLASGEKLLSSKIRMATLMDGFMKELDYYWFADKRGWVASESMYGTRIQLMR